MLSTVQKSQNMENLNSAFRPWIADCLPGGTIDLDLATASRQLDPKNVYLVTHLHYCWPHYKRNVQCHTVGNIFMFDKTWSVWTIISGSNAWPPKAVFTQSSS